MLNSFTFSQFNLPKRKPWKEPNYELCPDFDLDFDDNTYIYDIFYNNYNLYIIMPYWGSHTNSWDAVDQLKSNLLIGNKSINELPHKLINSWGTVLIFIVQCNFSDNFSLNSIPFIPKDYTNKTDKQKIILYTLQKNNKVDWIKDYINFYIEKFAIDTAIIYDNNSSYYSPIELSNSLSNLRVPVIVHSMPFKYGPRGYGSNDWSSLYLQTACLEHIRYSYASNTSILINADIDELIYLSNSLSLEQHLATSNTGALKIPGFWCHPKINFIDYDHILHSDHIISENSIGRMGNKYICDLSKMDERHLLRVHDILDIKKNGSALEVLDYSIGRFYHFSSLSRSTRVIEYNDNISLENFNYNNFQII